MLDWINFRILTSQIVWLPKQENWPWRQENEGQKERVAIQYLSKVLYKCTFFGVKYLQISVKSACFDLYLFVFVTQDIYIYFFFKCRFQIHWHLKLPKKGFINILFILAVSGICSTLSVNSVSLPDRAMFPKMFNLSNFPLKLVY